MSSADVLSASGGGNFVPIGAFGADALARLHRRQPKVAGSRHRRREAGLRFGCAFRARHNKLLCCASFDARRSPTIQLRFFPAPWKGVHVER